MVRNDLNSKLYFEWLISLLSNQSSNYIFLLELLFDYPFISKVKNDINRIEDGLFFRVSYTDETKKTFGNANTPCSVLEVLIGVAARVNDTNFDYNNPNNTPIWFWTLIKNLNLIEYRDDLIDPFSELEIKNKIDVFVNRGYEFNGSGGIFPLKRPYVDQRRLEIWYQMQAWIEENYDDP